jgi:hypothetical protein
MFKKHLLVIGVIALFLMSGCQIYEDIYGKSDVSTVSLDDIVVEGEEEERESPLDIFQRTEEEEEISEEEIEEEFVEEEIIEEEIGEIEETIIEIEEEIVEIPEEEIEIIEIVEEIEEEIPDEQAVVIIVQETDLVSLEPAATDPDGDPLEYTFTSPLDNIGDWQTTYGDAGEFTVTITASDGDLSASQDVLIIVNRREEAPSIDDLIPDESELRIKEDNIIDFSVSASDLNSDDLYYEWKIDGEEVSDDTSYSYELDYDSAGSHTVKLAITDGTLETAQIWAITVENVNREPEMGEIGNIAIRENEPVIVVLEASDPDGDALNFIIDSDKFVQEGNVFTWDTTYDDAGSYDITLTVSDGDLSVSQQINVAVENVNRAPVFLGIEQK